MLPFDQIRRQSQQLMEREGEENNKKADFRASQGLRVQPKWIFTPKKLSAYLIHFPIISPFHLIPACPHSNCPHWLSLCSPPIFSSEVISLIAGFEYAVRRWYQEGYFPFPCPMNLCLRSDENLQELIDLTAPTFVKELDYEIEASHQRRFADTVKVAQDFLLLGDVWDAGLGRLGGLVLRILFGSRTPDWRESSPQPPLHGLSMGSPTICGHVLIGGGVECFYIKGDHWFEWIKMNQPDPLQTGSGRSMLQLVSTLSKCPTLSWPGLLDLDPKGAHFLLPGLWPHQWHHRCSRDSFC